MAATDQREVDGSFRQDFHHRVSPIDLRLTLRSLPPAAVARAVWLVVREEDEAGKPARLLLPVKCNYADTAGLRYRIVNGAVVFDADAIVTDADSALANKKPKEEKDSAVDVACDWLRQQLENQPPKPAKDLLASAKAEGISEKTLHRAKTNLGIEVQKVGFSKGFVWRWPDVLL